MLESIYVGLTGLSTFAKGLNSISNNVANLNTPAFKRKQAVFEDLFYRQQFSGGSNDEQLVMGSGVGIRNNSIVFTQGELRQTGNDQDAAIDGNGYFILQDNGKTFYTRDGGFDVNSDGYLISRSGTARVMVLDANNRLQDLNITTQRISPPKATQLIKLDGNLSRADSDRQHTVSDINVYDGKGGNQLIRILFSFNASNASLWTFSVQDASSATLASGQITFAADGSVESTSEKFNFNYTPAGSSTQAITIQFGKNGQFDGLTNFSMGTDSSAKLLSADGYSVGALNTITYGSDGKINLNYSNGQKVSTHKLALAWFDFASNLTEEGSNRYANNTAQKPVIGAAQTLMFGKIAGGRIEGSNVDLTQQFSELIITQRGYQASSQVLSTTNEMIQQLLDTKAKRS